MTTDLNKITATKLGDHINYYINGKTEDGIVIKMDNSYLTVLKTDGQIHDIHINDTFFVKDIILNKTWDQMDQNERYDALVKIHAPTPRYLMKSWKELPQDLKTLLTKDDDVELTEGGEKVYNEAKDEIKNSLSPTGIYKTEMINKNGDIPNSEQASQKENEVKEEWNGQIQSRGKSEEEFYPNDLYKSWLENKSDVEQGAYGGINTDTPFDAEGDYEEDSDDRNEQFKHERKKPNDKKKESMSTGTGGVANPNYGNAGQPYDTKTQHGSYKKDRVSDQGKDKK